MPIPNPDQRGGVDCRINGIMPFVIKLKPTIKDTIKRIIKGVGTGKIIMVETDIIVTIIPSIIIGRLPNLLAQNPAGKDAKARVKPKDSMVMVTLSGDNWVLRVLPKLSISKRDPQDMVQPVRKMKDRL